MGKVLVVEDNLANQRLMRMLLESQGHEVRCSMTGEEGWALVQEGGYDLVLLDMHLPGIDGFQLARRIKDRLGSGVRIVAVTAMAMEGDRNKVLDSGCDEYISKPISVSEFRSRMEALLGGGSDG